jgi:acetylornithine deacetylase
MTDTAQIDRQRLKKLLHRLIDIYSPSGKEEEILEYLGYFLKRQGLPVTRQKVAEGRYNLVVAPPGEEIQLALVGHVDTVPAHDLDDYEYQQEGDLITGLGAADMKSGCAAMIEAYLGWWAQRQPGKAVALALVVGEEEEGDGAAELVDEYEFPWALIGEPTDLNPCPSNYGYLEVQLTAKGVRRHASLATHGQNAVETMLRLVLTLTKHLEANRPEIVYNIRDLWSAQAGFTVPELSEAWLDLHLPPSAPVGEIMTELEEIAKAENEKNPRSDAGLRFATIDSGFELPEKGPVLESLKVIYERRGLVWAPTPFRSHSDANQLWEAGVRPVILGPGRLEQAHSPDESISFDQVQLAAEIYLDLCLALTAGTG